MVSVLSLVSHYILARLPYLLLYLTSALCYLYRPGQVCAVLPASVSVAMSGTASANQTAAITMAVGTLAVGTLAVATMVATTVVAALSLVTRHSTSLTHQCQPRRTTVGTEAV